MLIQGQTTKDNWLRFLNIPIDSGPSSTQKSKRNFLGGESKGPIGSWNGEAVKPFSNL
jgi:hypothetical protein